MKQVLFFLGLLFCSVQMGHSQVTFVITNIPDDTSKDLNIYISGDFEETILWLFNK